MSLSVCSQEVEVYSKNTDKLISSGMMTCENIDTLKRLGYKIIELTARPEEIIIEETGVPSLPEPVEFSPVTIPQPELTQQSRQKLQNWLADYKKNVKPNTAWGLGDLIMHADKLGLSHLIEYEPLPEVTQVPEVIAINEIPVQSIEQVNIIQPVLRVDQGVLLTSTLRIIEEKDTLKASNTELKLLNQNLKNENDELVSKYSDSATKAELDQSSSNLQRAIQEAESFKNQALSLSAERVGIHPKPAGREIQNRKHQSSLSSINSQWENFLKEIE